MALSTVGLVASGAALAAYLDARFHIINDLKLGSNIMNRTKMMDFIADRMKQQKMLIYHIFEDRVGTPMGNNVFLIFENKSWTYNEFFRALQPVGNWLLKDLGVQKDEVVAVDGTNSPEFLLLWFALEGIGATPAFINCNLTAQPLLHSVKLSGARYLLADNTSYGLVSPVEHELTKFGATAIIYSPRFFASLKDTTPLPASRRKEIDPATPACLIFTSGTTGMPKGTIMTRGREIGLTRQYTSHYLPLKPGDKMYTCLPLYHGAAHGLCVAPVIGAGATVVLSRKFSHRTFWPEVHNSGATHLQYVGELCRYLINAAPHPLEQKHKVRMAWGNGMRPDVWEKFRERFNIEIINELYAATDGLGFTTNANRGEFSRHSIALRGPLWHLLNGSLEKRIAIDPDTQEVMRGDDGLAIMCGPGEAGETVYKIDPENPDTSHPTYFGNHGAATKRRLRNVVTKGDMWFRSGDLMRLDTDGRLTFVDRLGDTFRWRSENVSTNEVAEVVNAFPQIAEANVYGVLVPNADGRAGCAAIVPVEGVSAESLDWNGLAAHCLGTLPRYAVPIFVRVATQLEYTGTMKMQKGRLRTEGVDVDVISKVATEKGAKADSMYWLPPGEKTYSLFTKKELALLHNGQARL